MGATRLPDGDLDIVRLHSRRAEGMTDDELAAELDVPSIRSHREVYAFELDMRGVLAALGTKNRHSGSFAPGSGPSGAGLESTDA